MLLSTNNFIVIDGVHESVMQDSGTKRYYVRHYLKEETGGYQEWNAMSIDLLHARVKLTMGNVGATWIIDR